MAQLQSRAHQVLRTKTLQAMEDALEIATRVARQNATKRTGKWAGSIRHTTAYLHGRTLVSGQVGSSLISAVAHERGAYIQAKAKPTLVFQVGGRWVRPKAVRLHARPVIRPAVVASFRHAYGDSFRIHTVR